VRRALRFRFNGELNDFLDREQRGLEFAYEAGVTDTLKHIIESLGVPHTEVGMVRINGEIAPLDATPRTGDSIEVYPHETPVKLNDARFVVDGHLGRLAAYLRMLGFDSWYRALADDAELAKVAGSEHRVLLTRDAGLLKRRAVERGYFVRSDKPLDQLREVNARFDLAKSAKPFSRCMECNGELRPVAKQDVEDLLPPHTRATKTEFSRCANCGRIYWRGSHYERMLGWIAEL
jgi:uncharacterized protein with PIN domain